MLGDPLRHLDGEPEGIDTESDDGEKEPLDVVAEQLSARAIEGELMSVDYGVLNIPSFFHTNRPRESDTKGYNDEDRLQNADADHSEKSACELRIHNVSPLIE